MCAKPLGLDAGAIQPSFATYLVAQEEATSESPRPTPNERYWQRWVVSGIGVYILHTEIFQVSRCVQSTALSDISTLADVHGNFFLQHLYRSCETREDRKNGLLGDTIPNSAQSNGKKIINKFLFDFFVNQSSLFSSISRNSRTYLLDFLLRGCYIKASTYMQKILRAHKFLEQTILYF